MAERKIGDNLYYDDQTGQFYRRNYFALFAWAIVILIGVPTVIHFIIKWW